MGGMLSRKKRRKGYGVLFLLAFKASRKQAFLKLKKRKPKLKLYLCFM
jgi:hypothetical protein